MKAQDIDRKAANLGPFLSLIWTLTEQRSQTESEASSAAVSSSPLSSAAIRAAIEEVANHEQPLRRSPIVLGPFLTMLLTLAERKPPGPTPWLRSSTVLASPR
jgi:hypothetical protein